LDEKRAIEEKERLAANQQEIDRQNVEKAAKKLESQIKQIARDAESIKQA
jgi:hypothetical protein